MNVLRLRLTHGTIILRLCFEQVWLLALSRAYESIFPFDRGVIKGQWNINFFLGLQRETCGPVEENHCCVAHCCRGYQRLFYIHCCNERAESTERTQWLPTYSPPSVLLLIVYKYYSELRIASPNRDPLLQKPAQAPFALGNGQCAHNIYISVVLS